jgi:hypothetical protein
MIGELAAGGEDFAVMAEKEGFPADPSRSLGGSTDQDADGV